VTAPAPSFAGLGAGRPLDRFRIILIAAAATLTAAVAGLAFWVSFEAISAYVVRIGAFPADLRYAGPLLVDSFTVLATVFLLWLALAGTPLRRVWDAWYAWALIITATAASAYLNAAHVAPGAPDVARVVAGAVPVTLLGAVHLLVLLLLRLLAGRPQARPDWPVPVPETPAPERDVPPTLPAPGPVQPDQPQRTRTRTNGNGSRFTADQRQRIADQVGRGMSAKAIQRELGMSDRAYRDHLLPLVRSIQEVRS
jgi:hypothetical protein